jgi:hypothetical protein
MSDLSAISDPMGFSADIVTFLTAAYVILVTILLWQSAAKTVRDNIARTIHSMVYSEQRLVLLYDKLSQGVREFIASTLEDGPRQVRLLDATLCDLRRMLNTLASNAKTSILAASTFTALFRLRV